jgi:hypothetical protein
MWSNKVNASGTENSIELQNACGTRVSAVQYTAWVKCEIHATYGLNMRGTVCELTHARTATNHIKHT